MFIASRMNAAAVPPVSPLLTVMSRECQYFRQPRALLATHLFKQN
jgi:hypothetical protein